jgi:hypothetical protein
MDIDQFVTCPGGDRGPALRLMREQAGSLNRAEESAQPPSAGS